MCGASIVALVTAAFNYLAQKQVAVENLKSEHPLLSTVAVAGAAVTVLWVCNIATVCLVAAALPLSVNLLHAASRNRDAPVDGPKGKKSDKTADKQADKVDDLLVDRKTPMARLLDMIGSVKCDEPKADKDE